MYKGGCLCGKIRFEIIGKIKNIVYCHCSKCRKAQGTAFATNGNIDKNNFQSLLGYNDLTAYKSSPEQTKYFCKYCGSPIFSKNLLKPKNIRIRLGSIESDITERPEAHIFAISKANWEKIKDDLPKYESYGLIKLI